MLKIVHEGIELPGECPDMQSFHDAWEPLGWRLAGDSTPGEMVAAQRRLASAAALDTITGLAIAEWLDDHTVDEAVELLLTVSDEDRPAAADALLAAEKAGKKRKGLVDALTSPNAHPVPDSDDVVADTPEA